MKSLLTSIKNLCSSLIGSNTDNGAIAEQGNNTPVTKHVSYEAETINDDDRKAPADWVTENHINKEEWLDYMDEKHRQEREGKVGSISSMNKP